MPIPVIIFITVLIALFIIAANSKGFILLEYIRKQANDHFELSVSALWGLIKYKYVVPKIEWTSSGIRTQLLRTKGRKGKKTDESEGRFELRDINAFFSRNDGLLDFIKHHAIVGEFALDMRYGTGDAFFTGISGGILWTLAGAITAFLENTFTVQKRNVRITPDFNEKVLELDLFCIFHLKIAHIIVVILKISKDFLHRKRAKK